MHQGNIMFHLWDVDQGELSGSQDGREEKRQHSWDEKLLSEGYSVPQDPESPVAA